MILSFKSQLLGFHPFALQLIGNFWSSPHLSVKSTYHRVVGINIYVEKQKMHARDFDVKETPCKSLLVLFLCKWAYVYMAKFLVCVDYNGTVV